MNSETARSPEEIDPDIFLAYDFSGIEADNQRYRLALESIDIGVFEYYPPIDHFEANYIWYQLTGLKRGDGLNGRFSANVPPEKHQEILDCSRKERARTDGSRIHLALLNIPTRAIDGSQRNGIHHFA